MTPCATHHALARTIERVRIVPRDGVWRQVVLDITGAVLGEATGAELKRVWPDGREKWIVDLAGVRAAVIWKPEQAVVVTVMR